MAHQYTMDERLEQLHERRAKVEAGGGEAKLEKQRAQGKLTARDRVASLLDEGSFQETGAFRRNRTTAFGMDKADMPADGVVTGSGSVLGRPCTSLRRTSPSWAVPQARRTRSRSPKR